MRSAWRRGRDICTRRRRIGRWSVLAGLPPGRSRFLVLCLLFRNLVADDAARHGAGDGVMSGNMPRHPANYGTLDATFGKDWTLHQA